MKMKTELIEIIKTLSPAEQRAMALELIEVGEILISLSKPDLLKNEAGRYSTN